MLRSDSASLRPRRVPHPWRDTSGIRARGGSAAETGIPILVKSQVLVLYAR
jgi:hypothetical protein